MTEYLLPSILGDNPQMRMRRAWQMGISVDWIRSAERVISGKFATVPWHLEDPDGETIDDAYPNAYAKEAYRLLARPQSQLEVGQRKPRTVIWALTSRHMGLCGPAFWFFDQPNAYGIPLNIVYIRPDRVEAGADANGNLEKWIIDRKPGNKGVTADLDQMLQFNLEPPDDGYFGIGLVESAMHKAQLSQSFDKYLQDIMATGGRIAGIISPKMGSLEGNAYEQAIRDWRSIAEQPNAGRRLQVVQAPVEFIKTAQTTAESAVAKLMTEVRDDLLNIWGVPLSQLGGYSPAGLNSGDVRKYDEAALWQNAIHPRLVPFIETLQTGLLDRYEPLLGGWTPKLIVDEPEFDDDSPRYAMAVQALGLPLTGAERREQVGLEPLGPEVIGPSGKPVDEEIYIQNLMTPLALLGGYTQAPPPASMPGFVPPLQDEDEPGVDRPVSHWRGRPAPTVKPAPTPPAKPAPTPPAKPAPTPPAVAKKAGLSQADIRLAVHGILDTQYPKKLTNWVDEATWEFNPELPIKGIEVPPRSKDRLDPDRVNFISALLATGANTRPIVIVDTTQVPGGTALADGWHHIAAYRANNMKTIPAYIASGTAAANAPADVMQSKKYDPANRKASLGAGLKELRTRLLETETPQIAATVRRVLEEQQRSIVARVRTLPAYRLKDPAHLWPAAMRNEWDQALANALRPHLESMTGELRSHIMAELQPGKASSLLMVNPSAPPPPAALQRILDRGAARVQGINERTRIALQKIIADGVNEGLPPAAIADLIEAGVLDNGVALFDEYRAELIARTEVNEAYRDGEIGSYGEVGVEMVEAVDGDGDDLCADRDGKTFTLDDADAEEEHPNGTLDWLPVIE
jgi:phage portal protein BeeE